MVANSASDASLGRLQPGDLVAEKYRVERLLGEGAMGSVWAVTNELTERRFALKLVTPANRDDPELKARLLREARAAGRIAHRNVVEVYDVGQSADGAPFLVMQLLDGETLEQRLRRAGPIASAHAMAIAADIARGLVAAHTAGIVHRDLKPANVFLHRELDGADVVKVVDFGVSKMLTAADSTSSITGLAVGSPAYMSPEQARGERTIDHRSDLWALGVVLFEMVSGSRPFDGDTPYDTVAEILKGSIPSLAEYVPGVDPGVERVVARCLQRRRDDRPSSARELLGELEAVLGSLAHSNVSRPSLPAIHPVTGTERTAVLESAPGECDIADEDETVVNRSRSAPITELVEDTLPLATANVSTVSPSTQTAPRLTAPAGSTPRRRLALVAAIGSSALVLWVTLGVLIVRAVGEPEGTIAGASPMESLSPATPARSPSAASYDITEEQLPAAATPAASSSSQIPTPLPSLSAPKPKSNARAPVKPQASSTAKPPRPSGGVAPKGNPFE